MLVSLNLTTCQTNFTCQGKIWFPESNKASKVKKKVNKMDQCDKTTK